MHIISIKTTQPNVMLLARKSSNKVILNINVNHY